LILLIFFPHKKSSHLPIDINTGELRIDKPVDRERLVSTSGVINLKVRAAELVNGQPGIYFYTFA
jgi:hypothetical protein